MAKTAKTATKTVKKKERKLNLGVVGLGWPGQRHAEAILASRTGVLYACADASAERRAEFVRDFGPKHVFATQEELLADPAVDAVVTCLPNALHFPSTLAALEAGKHVLCEKPPTLNAAEMRVLAEEAGRRALVYFFGRQSRFSAAMLAAKQLVDAGRLGPIYFGKTVFIRSRGIPAGVGGWFTDKSRAGGGALIDLGVHAIDSVWYLMGTPKPTSVSAGVYQNFRDHVNVPVFDVDDGAYGMIRFENGAVVQFEVSWAANLTDDIPAHPYFDRELVNSTVYGPKATIRLHPLAIFEDQDGRLVKAAIEPEGEDRRFALQMQNFLDAVAGRAKPVNSAQQAVYLMEMLDAIYLSSATGREVPLA